MNSPNTNPYLPCISFANPNSFAPKKLSRLLSCHTGRQWSRQSLNISQCIQHFAKNTESMENPVNSSLPPQSSIYVNDKPDKVHIGFNALKHIADGSYCEVFKMPVLKASKNPQSSFRWKSKALIKIKHCDDIDTNNYGIAIQRVVQKHYGKHQCQLTRVPEEIRPGFYVQRYYPNSLYDLLNKKKATLVFA